MTEQEYAYYVQEFNKEARGEAEARTGRAYKQREMFLGLFPVERIPSLSLYDYVFAKSGYGNRNSFCCLMKSGLEDIAHTGDAMPDIYGIYYKGGTELKLSRTYQKLWGNDFDNAFKTIKSEIYQLLVSIGNDDYSIIGSIHLESRFLHKILAVYFPGKFLPICTLSMRDEVCEAMEIGIGQGRDMIFDNIRLRELKESREATRCWDNEVFLGFCRFVGEKKDNVVPAAMRRKMAAQRAVKIQQEIDKLGLTGEEKESVVKIRVNQDIYRDALLKRYHSCALCKVNNPQLLVASHIKPWADSTPDERLDEDNGFLFCPNHDKLFDRGFISFGEDGRIMISEEMTQINCLFMNVSADMKVELTDRQKMFLEYHRDNIFRGETQ